MEVAIDSASLTKCSHTTSRFSNLKIHSVFEDNFASDCTPKSEVINSSREVRSLRACDKSKSILFYRLQLEQDVQRLQQQLHKEIELHAVLENGVTNAAGTSNVSCLESAAGASDVSCFPHGVQQLLSNIATLEVTVSQLEQQMVSLHYQLTQERNERRLAEYRLRHSASPLLSHSSSDNVKATSTLDCDTLVHNKKASIQVFEIAEEVKLSKYIQTESLWNYPNLLSEEMVRCMKNIFISLADSSIASSKSPFLITQVDLSCNKEMLAPGDIFDPYRVRAKLSWADIGSYGSAIEVSWMSVGKKKLEFAAGALRGFRLLIEQLAKVNPTHLRSDEKLAFWINIYNALIMHAYLAYGVPRGDLKLFSLMQKAAYTVGGHSFNASTIEYAILRMKPPLHKPQTALLLALHKLKISEVQRNFAIDTMEPLVAFALSCGMYSSPAVRIYSAANVREELQEAQRDFIRASVGISSKGKLLVPKMLHCFARGFVDDANLAVWISRFLPPQQAAFVEQCISRRCQSFLASHNCGILSFDSHFRYLFLPENSP